MDFKSKKPPFPYLWLNAISRHFLGMLARLFSKIVQLLSVTLHSSLPVIVKFKCIIPISLHLKKLYSCAAFKLKQKIKAKNT